MAASSGKKKSILVIPCGKKHERLHHHATPVQLLDFVQANHPDECSQGHPVKPIQAGWWDDWIITSGVGANLLRQDCKPISH